MSTDKKDPGLQKITIAHEDAQKQWDLLADEYTIGSVEDLGNGLDKVYPVVMRHIEAGMIEIEESPSDGVVIKQFLRRQPPGVDSNPLVYGAPNTGHIARAGVGSETDMTNHTRYMRVASAASKVPEQFIGLLNGGDRSRMELIGQLFLLL